MLACSLLHIASEHPQAHKAQFHYQRGIEGLTLYSPIQKAQNQKQESVVTWGPDLEEVSFHSSHKVNE